MKHAYTDITSLIPDSPLWWDEHGVPRYAEFAPSLASDIYADEVVLLLIRCQNCAQPFQVAVSLSLIKRLMAKQQHGEGRSLRQIIHEDGGLDYGDPPNVECCALGPSMCSITLQVLQFWEKPNDGALPRQWQRRPEFEIEVDDDE